MAISKLKSNKDYLITKLAEYGCHLSGDKHHYNCCFHGGSDSLSIREKNGIWNYMCWNCGEKGSVIDLVEKMEKVSTREAIEILCKQFGIENNAMTPPKAEEVFKEPVEAPRDVVEESKEPNTEITLEDKSVESKEVLTNEPTEDKQEEDHTNFILQAHKGATKTDYFHKRGFSDDTINKYQLGYIENYKRGKANYGEAAIIPYPGENYYIPRLIKCPEWFANGKVRYMKLKEIDEPIFNLKKLQKGPEPVFITEGQFDCLSFIELGANSIGLNGVNGVTKLLDMLKGKKIHRPFIIALDEDDSGKEAKEKLKKGLDELNIYYYVFDIPKKEGIKDPNDLLVNDRDNFKKLVATATDEALKGFKEFEENKQLNKIYGDYYYNEKDNILFKVVEVEKKGKPELKYIPIYDGDLRIIGTSINIDKDKERGTETLKLRSKMAFTTEKEVDANILLGNSTKFAEALNSKKGFKVKPKKNIQLSLQDYLYDQYLGLEKEGLLKEKYVTERIGFVKNNKQSRPIDTFVYPNKNITLGDNLYYIEDGNYNNIFTSSGTSEEWIENVLKPSLVSKNIKIMILGVFASILIEPLNVHENFIIELSGNTGTSKTTALNVCASIFGNPGQYITDWRTTSTAVVSKATEINVFPLMLDDTKKCQDKKMITNLVYSLSSGKDKARSDITGKAREVKTFKNTTITCGEVPLHDYLTEGRGALSRFISLEGGALEKSNENKVIADKLNMCTHRYYGSIGLDFIKWLIKKIKDVDYLSMINDLYLTYLQQLPKTAVNDMAQRRCNHIALLKTAGYILEQFLGQDYFNYETLINKLVLEINQNSKESDVINQAYEGVMEFCTKNSEAFYREIEINGTTALDVDTLVNNNKKFTAIGQIKDGYYMFYEKKDLINIIQDYGDVTDILRNFKDRGYLITNKGSNQFAKAVAKITDKKVKRMYVINPGPYQKEVEDELADEELEELDKRWRAEEKFKEVEDNIMPFC